MAWIKKEDQGIASFYCLKQVGETSFKNHGLLEAKNWRIKLQDITFAWGESSLKTMLLEVKIDVSSLKNEDYSLREDQESSA